jgi:hypothetical protein
MNIYETTSSVHGVPALAAPVLIVIQIRVAFLLVSLVIKKNWNIVRNVGAWYLAGTSFILTAWLAVWIWGEENRLGVALILIGNILAGILPISWLLEARNKPQRTR